MQALALSTCGQQESVTGAYGTPVYMVRNLKHQQKSAKVPSQQLQACKLQSLPLQHQQRIKLKMSPPARPSNNRHWNRTKERRNAMKGQEQFFFFTREGVEGWGQTPLKHLELILERMGRWKLDLCGILKNCNEGNLLLGALF